MRPILLALLVALPALGVAGAAGPAHAGWEAFENRPPYEERPWFDTYSRYVYTFNQWVYSTLHGASGEADAKPAAQPTAEDPPPAAPPAPPSPLLTGIGHMASNIVNEPMSFLAATVTGDGGAMARSAGRFAVNSTVGLLGFYDVASDWGMAPYHTDLGLALCAHGVAEGPYLVIPFIGPRTLRDGITDVVITNAVLYSMFMPLMPPGSGLETILMVEAIEIVADIAATRQIDTRAKAMPYDDYDRMRDAYLAQRRDRCTALIAERAAKTTVAEAPKPALARP
ncbi:MlaA family lipoprotein [Azospirillum sp. A39]|uniref:MlaA family lipoprotein n=1 Tax=Azospirillum sp. A39 TaxID=3462279 RepID=UPI00404566CA